MQLTTEKSEERAWHKTIQKGPFFIKQDTGLEDLY